MNDQLHRESICLITSTPHWHRPNYHGFNDRSTCSIVQFRWLNPDRCASLPPPLSPSHNRTWMQCHRHDTRSTAFVFPVHPSCNVLLVEMLILCVLLWCISNLTQRDSTHNQTHTVPGAGVSHMLRFKIMVTTPGTWRSACRHRVNASKSSDIH